MAKTQNDQQLRTDRMVFYERDVEDLNRELDAFLELSKARCCMLIDREGHLVTRRGEPLKTSTESISALVAGSFAATKEMAHLLGQDEFTVMFHQGVRESIQLQLVGDRTLLTILFDERTNLGLVRFYAQECVRRIAEIFERKAQRTGDAELDGNFSSEAEAALDDLF
jgi:predicted regulator of Ras-like GTPase activity (Roadblock/LC7/MglB family)